MIITRETDYAVRILRALADFQLKTIKEICDDQYIPRQFAYKISKKLEKAGYIEIVRGATGGCRLKLDLREITLMDLISVMNRENMVSCCLTEENDCQYKKQHSGCCVHSYLCQLQGRLTEIFKTLSMQDIIFGSENAPIETRTEA